VGASNALAAFRLYAGKVPPLSINVLVFMSLVAMDKDREPEYWEGHEALAVHCLGRDEASIDGSDLRAVRRAITPLFEKGAITVTRHSSGRGEKGVTARYRLWLVTPAPDEKRPVDNQDAVSPSPDGNRPTAGASIGRKVADHRTKSGRAPDGNRPAKEYEETEELEERQEYPLPPSDSVPVRAREVPDESDETMSVRVIPSRLAAVPPSAASRCQYTACGSPAAPIGDDEYHERCRHLAAVKARADPLRMREHPEAS
jgi:hypothetical protein